MFEFAQVVGTFVKHWLPVMPALPPMVVSRRPLAFIPTYDTTPNSPPGYWLPFHVGRLGDLYGVDVWHWVYHCRKVFAPFPALHRDHPWPSATHVWVGPDGVPINKDGETQLLNLRADLHTKQLLKGNKNKGAKEIGWLHGSPRPTPLLGALCQSTRGGRYAVRENGRQQNFANFCGSKFADTLCVIFLSGFKH